jgi:hypothetical protein
MFIASKPNWFKRIICWLLNNFTKEQRTVKKIQAMMDKNHFEINELYQRAEKFRADFDQKW